MLVCKLTKSHVSCAIGQNQHYQNNHNRQNNVYNNKISNRNSTQKMHQWRRRRHEELVLRCPRQNERLPWNSAGLYKKRKPVKWPFLLPLSLLTIIKMALIVMLYHLLQRTHVRLLTLSILLVRNWHMSTWMVCKIRVYSFHVILFTHLEQPFQSVCACLFLDCCVLINSTHVVAE